MKKINPSTKPMLIVIPTRGREDKAMQKAFYQMPENLLPYAKVVTQQSLRDKLITACPGMHGRIYTCPDTIDCVATKRQYCIKAFNGLTDKVWMVDDVCKLQKRDPDGRVTGWATHAEINEMYDNLSALLDEVPVCGLTPRGFNKPSTTGIEYNKRFYSNYAIRTDIAAQEGIKFSGMWEKDNRIKLMEDFYLILSFMIKGYRTAALTDYIIEHMAHNRKGGNSLIRSNEMQLLCCQALKKEFPEFVEIVYKERKGDWKGMEDRPDVAVKWKQAYEYGCSQLTAASGGALGAFFL